MTLTALFFSFVIASFFIAVLVEKICHLYEIYDLPDTRKVHIVPTPRMGGASFFILSSILIFLGYRPFSWMVLVGALIVYAGGLIDDVKELNSALVKLISQVPAAALVAVSISLSIWQLNVFSEICLRLVIFGYVLFMINAANLMDNMNGLTSGLSLVWLSILAFLCYQFNLSIYGEFLILLIAAILGFYLRNFPWGKIYMGDQGSQFLGYLLAVFALFVIQDVVRFSAVPSLWNCFLRIFCLSLVFLIDVTAVVIIRLREKRPIWKGDKCHLSHQLVQRGLSQSAAVLTLTFFQVLCGVGAFYFVFSK